MSLQLSGWIISSADHNVDIPLQQLLQAEVVGWVVEEALCAKSQRRASVDEPATGTRRRCLDHSSSSNSLQDLHELLH